MLLCRFIEAQHVAIYTPHCCNLIKSNLYKILKPFITIPENILNMPTDIEVITFPWISYLMGPSNSAPKAMSFVTVVLMSVTVNDSKEEYPFCTR